MDDAKKEYFRRLLLEEREKHRRMLGTTEEGLRDSLRESTGELSAVDNHPADLGTEEFERAKDLALQSGARRILRDIDEALLRLKEGTYGWCELCGAPIPEGRLEAMPATSLCLECRAVLEDEVPAGRPVEESVIGPPFGRGFSAGTGGGLDDEDDWNAWDAVARYGTSSDIVEDHPEEDQPQL